MDINNKSQSTEQKVRSLDNTLLRVSEIARKISPKLRLSKNTCLNILYAKRAGYASCADYKDALAKAKGFYSEIEREDFRKAQMRYGSDYTLEQWRSQPKDASQQALKKYLSGDSVSLKALVDSNSKNEKKVRRLDDPKLPIVKSSRKIAKRTGLSFSTCFKYVFCLRNNITGKIYDDFLAQEAGFKSSSEQDAYGPRRLKNPSLSLEDFRESRARESDFESIDSYLRFLEDRNVFFPPGRVCKTKSAQKIFEYATLTFFDPSEMSEIVPAKGSFPPDFPNKEEFWETVRNALTTTEYAVIEARFHDATLKEIETDLSIKGGGVSLIKIKALRKLRHPRKKELLDKFL